MPFGPLHCALVRHSTHSFATSSQTGSAGVQAVRFGVEHSAQLPALAPVVRHAGLRALEHAARVAAPRSPSHAMHAPAALQIGVLPEHCALLPHCTQVWLVELQAGLAPPQRRTSPSLHSTQLPVPGPFVRHAGAVATLHAAGVAEPRFPSHGTHAPALQMGVAPPQAASVKHATHVFVAGSHDGVPPLH